MLLGDQKFSILHYQVYSHLKRLGYIVTRFDPSSILSSYQRQLNVESFTKPPRKRKRSTSPRLKSKIKLDTVRDMEKDNDNVMFIGIGSLASIKTDTFSSNPVARTKDIQSNSQLVSTDHQNISVNQEAGVQLQTQDCILNCSKSGNSAVEGPVKTVRTHRWDFSKICLPNCGHQLPYTLLPLPEPTFLPENITAREVDISHWMLKLNMRPEKLSQREREQLNWERKYKSSINNDPKVKKCSNWREYKELLLQRSHSSSKSSPHLWASAVKPLLRPEIINTTASVLDQITVMSPSLLLDDCESWPQSHKKNLPQIIFNVYQADGASDFKKSKPGKPYTRMCVRSFDDQVPSLHTVKMLVYQSGDVPLIFALVDNGEVAFYSFKDFKLPVDIYP
ncbi:hypothetical protein GDO86_011657 [Hymenochirus boettgeri]|nr:hypothetical protein GDO86_011657 [Hymenochirus boettgeri]